MKTESIVHEFTAFRAAAKRLLAEDVSPDCVRWIDAAGDLFSTTGTESAMPNPSLPSGESRSEGDLRTTQLDARPHPNLLPEGEGTAASALQSTVEYQAPSSFSHREKAGMRANAEGRSDANSNPLQVPKRYVEMAKLAILHRSADRCALLYRILWRLTHGEHELLHIAIDDDINQLMAYEKAVRRDRHKMTAFVRFRKIAEDSVDTGEHFMAWHRPDHHIVRLVAPFFVDRFASMRWTIFTPDESMTWDGNALTFGKGVASDPFAGEDAVQSLWTTYYANIFNPARIKLKAMQKEMPKKHWATMPETALIPELLRAAPQRVATMIKHGRSMETAASIVPADRSLPVLRAAAASCRACPIGCNATQTVFGQGPADARIVFVGEQPGDEEDRAGQPFVGPAGRLLDSVMQEIGFDRSAVYVTNAVKHFKWEPRGKKRMHSKPSAREMAACKPWVEAELETIKPQFLVMLGNTAGHTLVGHHLRVTRDRGQWMQTRWCERTMFTFHPSAILRAYDATAEREMRSMLAADLRMVMDAAAKKE